jgi:hypothetical protein
MKLGHPDSWLRGSKLDIDPMGGEELAKTVAGLFKLKPAIIAKIKEALAAK